MVKGRVLEMADDEKGENTSIHGTDWEVVSLTASAYAAAPGPKAFDPSVESKEEINKEEQVADTATFMSNHFIFPPDEHKHLLLESDCSEIQYEAGAHGVSLAEEELAEAIKADDDNWKLKSDDGLHGIQIFDKGKNLSDHGMEFGEGKPLEGLDVIGKEPDMYVEPTFSAFHATTDISQSVLCDENSNSAESTDLSYHSPEYLSDNTNASNLNEVNKPDVPGLPCEAWWKRHAMSVYNHAKEANTFWSVFVAAAVMGFVILGQQWQREKLQLQQLKWFTVSDEV